MGSHKSRLKRLIGAVLWVALCFGNAPARAACEAGVPCDKRAKESEFSWNPERQYVTPRLAHFYALDDEVKAAYDRADDAKLAALSEEYLELAAVYRCNWNYGNAIHDANRYLGLASLRHGNADEAARYLVLSGKSPGSPQLDSFGPDLDLADQLLKLGKTAAVTEYLKDIKHFWNMDDGQVDQWLAAIKNGEKPKLDRMASMMKPKAWMIAFQWVVMGLPALVAFSLTYARRKIARRKVILLIVGIACGYASLIALNWGLVYLAIHVAAFYSSRFTAVYLPMILVLAIPAMVVIGVFKYMESLSQEQAG